MQTMMERSAEQQCPVCRTARSNLVLRHAYSHVTDTASLAVLPLCAYELKRLRHASMCRYLSNMRSARRQLITYSRAVDLLPLLTTFAVQSIDAGGGAELECTSCVGLLFILSVDRSVPA
jgi:hypothetical protein